MAKSKQQKTEALENAKTKFDSSKLVVLASYKDLPVSQIQELRTQLKEKDVFYKVIKKTILKLVAKDNIDEEMVAGLRGNLTLAYSPDEVSAAKVLAKFAEDHDGLEIQAGWLENEFIDKTKVEELSKLLGKEELLAKLVGSLKSPISGFVNVLGGNTRGLVNVLKAIAESKS